MADVYEVKASLVYIVSYRWVRATQRSPVPEKQTKEKSVAPSILRPSPALLLRPKEPERVPDSVAIDFPFLVSP